MIRHRSLAVVAVSAAVLLVGCSDDNAADDVAATTLATTTAPATTVPAGDIEGDHDPTLTPEEIESLDTSALDDIDLELACEDAAELQLIGSGMSDLVSTNFEGEITLRGLSLPSEFHAELTRWASLVAEFYPNGMFDGETFEVVHNSDEFWSFQHRLIAWSDANCEPFG